MAGELKIKASLGEHYNLSQPLFDPFNNVIQKIHVSIVENIETAVSDAILEEAKARGITDWIVLDKKRIMSALGKQIPQKIDNIPEGDLVAGCHCCGEINALYKPNGDRCNYCGNCGQKIDWNEWCCD